MSIRTLKGLVFLLISLTTFLGLIYIISVIGLNSLAGYLFSLVFIHAGFSIFCLEYIATKWLKHKSINGDIERFKYKLKYTLQLLLGIAIFVLLFYYIIGILHGNEQDVKSISRIFGAFLSMVIFDISIYWLLLYCSISLAISFGVVQLHNSIIAKPFNLRWQYFFEYYIVIVFRIMFFTYLFFALFFRVVTDDFQTRVNLFDPFPPLLFLAIPFFVFFLYPIFLPKRFIIAISIFSTIYGLFSFLSPISFRFMEHHSIYEVLMVSMLNGIGIFLISYYFAYKKNEEALNEEQQKLIDYNNNIAQLQALKAQINPHFIFNTLNTLYGTALIEKADESADAIQKLGEMIRITLDESKQKVILLSEELNFIENYFTIHQLNIDSDQKIEGGVIINQEGELGNMQIQTFTILPFIQYLANYNTIFDFKKFINIFVEVAAHTVTIVIKSNILDGRLAEDEEIKKLIHKLDHFYGKNHSFHIIENNPMHIEIMINK